jgi:hypothetical protein
MSRLRSLLLLLTLNELDPVLVEPEPPSTEQGKGEVIMIMFL